MTTQEIMIMARTRLILDHPFWGCLALKLTLSEAEWCETACTDGRNVFYNPEYIKSLQLPEVVGLLAHEVSHCSNGHTWRQDTREHVQWNIACDYTLNDILIKAGFALPSGALINSQYNGLAAEEIYAKLPKENTGNKGGKDPGKCEKGKGSDGSEKHQGPDKGQNGKDPGKCGGVIQSSQSKADAEELRAEWKAAVVQAVQMCKGRGDIPGDLLLQIQNVLDPPLPWFVLLRDFVERSARNDYSWSKPNSRYFSSGIILPSLVSEELPEIVVAIDTSGSTYSYLNRFANEVSGVLQAYKTKITVIYCDYIVQNVVEYTSEDLPLKLEMKGGGGTSFIPVFDYVAKHGLTPAAMVFLTDLDGSFPKYEPEYPVMWVTPNNQKGPFGMTVKIIAE